MTDYHSKSRLYIVDDDEQTCSLLKTVAEVYFKVYIFHSGQDFLQQKFKNNDIVLLDLMMPNIDGIQVMRALANKKLKVTILLMSGYDSGVLYSSLKLAQEYGLNVVEYFTKPIDLHKLIESLILLQKSNELPQVQNTIHKNEKIKKFEPTVRDLQQAINRHEFMLYYQPQVNIKTKQFIGFEALIRWQHPIHGLVFPDAFIPLAESSKLIIKLTEEVINLAIKQTELWKNKQQNHSVSVNISAQNITSLTLPEQLTNLVADHKIDPGMLKLEITETALMTELTTSLDILTRLRLKGFQLSIDDFGTGYSSLSLLNRIPFTELKIDQSFVMSMLKSVESKAIVETCILLGHKLNMEVIAEGVESREIWEQLKNMGCDNAQGYYLAKPLPPKDAEHWVTSFLPNLI